MQIKATWDEDPSIVVRSMRGYHHRFTIDLALRAYDSLVSLTPVDTGRARAAWNISINQPVYVSYPRARTGTLVVPFPPRPNLESIPKGALIYITNGQPYIGQLENGSSKQAPLGMVRVTMQRLGR